MLDIVQDNPVALVQDAKSYADFYSKIKSEVDAFEPDTSTKTKRNEIAALAYKVTRTKTAIDAAGKQLNEDARAKINAVDAQRRKIREELDALAATARKPLTEWEAAEDARKEEIQKTVDLIKALSTVAAGDGSNYLTANLATLEALDIAQDTLGDAWEAISSEKQRSIEALRLAVSAASKYEADQAELARLREEQEARAQREFEQREQAEAERKEQERKEQEAAALKRHAEEAATAARLEEQRKAQAAIDQAEAEKRALVEAQEQETRQREAEAKRLADEQASRDADKAHRGKIMKSAKEAIMVYGADEESAKKIVLAIIAGEIPNVSLRF